MCFWRSTLRNISDTPVMAHHTLPRQGFPESSIDTAKPQIWGPDTRSITPKVVIFSLIPGLSLSSRLVCGSFQSQACGSRRGQKQRCSGSSTPQFWQDWACPVLWFPGNRDLRWFYGILSSFAFCKSLEEDAVTPSWALWADWLFTFLCSDQGWCQWDLATGILWGWVESQAAHTWDSDWNPLLETGKYLVQNKCSGTDLWRLGSVLGTGKDFTEQNQAMSMGLGTHRQGEKVLDIVST